MELVVITGFCAPFVDGDDGQKTAAQPVLI